MGDRTNATAAPLPATASTGGILRPGELARHLELERLPAADASARWVENHWFLRWQLPAGRSHPSQVISHPTVSLTAELGDHPRAGVDRRRAVVVTGVATRRFDVELRGEGRVCGVRFRPGGLAALSRRAASGWTDRTVPATTVLPSRLCDELLDPGLAVTPPRGRPPPTRGLPPSTRGPTNATTSCCVWSATCWPTARCSPSRMSPHVTGWAPVPCSGSSSTTSGWGPSGCWPATACTTWFGEIDAGYDGTLADLAHAYGWYDQAHFIRDFVALVGVTPGEYRAAARGSAAAAS